LGAFASGVASWLPQIPIYEDPGSPDMFRIPVGFWHHRCTRLSVALTKYHSTRNFKVTPEPEGATSVKRPRKELSFVIQKHQASHLHYDFRLEWKGVLLSWAIPKGPSLDPAVKRLAMPVEDHPLEYGNFEGTIPEGEYGAGTVMIWDRGYWVPEVPDVDGSLRSGQLKFSLYGTKLRGSWALVRTVIGEGTCKGTRETGTSLNSEFADTI
jgi:DNA ligase D-like protein (predicted 3'-phosphoesterase)